MDCSSRSLTFGSMLIVTFAASGSATDESGRAVYEATCIACHGPNGEGALPGVPDLTGPAGPLSKPDAELIDNMINGVQSPGSIMAMPPKGGNPALTRAEIERVLRYMREAFDSDPAQ